MLKHLGCFRELNTIRLKRQAIETSENLALRAHTNFQLVNSAHFTKWKGCTELKPPIHFKTIFQLFISSCITQMLNTIEYYLAYVNIIEY